MLSGFELFVDVMKNVLKDKQVEASNMARYFLAPFYTFLPTTLYVGHFATQPIEQRQSHELAHKNV